MTTINIYLNFNGNCEEAFNFYKKIFSGDFTYLSRFADMPPGGDYPVSEPDKVKIMHVSLTIGSSVLMGSDTVGIWANSFVAGNNYSVSVNPSSREEADKYFEDLLEGGKAVMPMSDTFWGAYYGSVTDRFGINWMINFTEQE